MEAHLRKACWRAGAKLVAGFAVIGAFVGIRIVTATPTGIEAEIAELERFEAERAATEAGGVPGTEPAAGAGAAAAGRTDSLLEGAPHPLAAPATGEAPSADPDRMVRCHLQGQTPFMRAADCGTRGGAVEELPAPEPEDPTASRATP